MTQWERESVALRDQGVLEGSEKLLRASRCLTGHPAKRCLTLNEAK